MNRPPRDQFDHFLRQGQEDEAIACWRAHAELRDWTQWGRECAERAVNSNSVKVLKAIVSESADYNGVMYNHIFRQTVSNVKPECMKAVLEAKPGILCETVAPHEILYAVEHDLQNAGFDDARRKAMKHCMQLLIDAKALSLRDDLTGTTALTWTMRRENQQSNMPYYAHRLMKAGADLLAVDGNGETVRSLYEKDKPLRENNYHKLQRLINLDMGWLQSFMQKHSPDVWLTEYQDESRAFRRVVHSLASSGNGAALTPHSYWQHHGGLDGARAFLEELKALIPGRLAYMRERLSEVDCSLLREEPGPHADSVLVAYAKGSVEPLAPIMKA